MFEDEQLMSEIRTFDREANLRRTPRDPTQQHRTDTVFQFPQVIIIIVIIIIIIIIIMLE